MGRFFEVPFKKGSPISIPGFARGIMRLAEAWERCRIIGGRITWDEALHIPTIHIDSTEELYPYKLAMIGGVLSMYMPAQSFIVNGKDFTALQTGLTGANDWYDVSSFATTGLNAYITFDNNAAQNEPGRPTAVEFGTEAPSGRVVTIPILQYDATNGIYSLHHGIINYERMSFDGAIESGNYKSIEETNDGGEWADENHSIQVAGFVTPDEPQATELFDGTDDFGYHFCVREWDSSSTPYKVKTKWFNADTMLEQIKDELTNDQTWQETLTYVETSYDGWLDWYTNQTDFIFWQQGADYTTNYGSSIGNSSSTQVIDLENLLFNGNWEFEEGTTVTNWFNGGILTGDDIIEIDASDIQPTDKVLVRR